MGKVFGILLIVIAIWAALEFYTDGSDHAMGGSLPGFSEVELPQGGSSFVTSAPQKARRSVQRSIDKSAKRYKNLLD